MTTSVTPFKTTPGGTPLQSALWRSSVHACDDVRETSYLCLRNLDRRVEGSVDEHSTGGGNPS